MNKELEQSIIATLAYFDQFDHPLTVEELLRWCWKYPAEVTRSTLLACIDASPSVDLFDGYVFLAGRQHIIASREARVTLVEQKMNIAKRGIKKLRWVPFVRAVFVCNTLAMGLVSKDSDIDVLIITKQKRIWIVRFFSNILLKVFRLRTGKRAHSNRLCLSFFVSEENLDFSQLQTADDIYLSYWIDQLVPLYDPKKIDQRLRNKNTWVKNNIPHGLLPYTVVPRWKVEETRWVQRVRSFFEHMWKGTYGDHMQTQMKKMQMQKFARRRITNDGTHVIVGDTMIKLHENDRREQYRDAWKKRLQGYE